MGVDSLCGCGMMGTLISKGALMFILHMSIITVMVIIAGLIIWNDLWMYEYSPWQFVTMAIANVAIMVGPVVMLPFLAIITIPLGVFQLLHSQDIKKSF
jgi:cytochrome b subunit of formate dehydrogenase